MEQCPPRSLLMERKWSSNNEVAPNCPRCASSNTKFCYYNNYSFSQPRYFCKGCRRYWTKGGSLRNVPVGGGCRKNRRSKSARSSMHSDRLGTSYVQSSPGHSSTDPLTISPSREIEPSEINLAEVFANYLNQKKLGSNNMVSSEESPTGTNSSSDETLGSLDFVRDLEDVMNNCIEPSDQVDETLFLEGIPQVFDPNAFELQTPLNTDGLVQQSLWQDRPRVQDFEWQPLGQTQEFGSFVSDDQFRISSNLLDDSWGSLDLSDYEIFSRP